MTQADDQRWLVELKQMRDRIDAEIFRLETEATIPRRAQAQLAAHQGRPTHRRRADPQRRDLGSAAAAGPHRGTRGDGGNDIHRRGDRCGRAGPGNRTRCSRRAHDPTAGHASFGNAGTARDRSCDARADVGNVATKRTSSIDEHADHIERRVHATVGATYGSHDRAGHIATARPAERTARQHD